MEVRKLVFPIALAIVWIVLAAMTMVDFARFDESTRPNRPVAAPKTVRVSQLARPARATLQ